MKSSKVLKSVFALLILALLLYLVNLSELWQALSQLTWELVLYLFGISVVLIYISALKWKIFLEALAAKVSLLYLFGLYLVGYFVNFLLPSYVGGDAVRSMYVGKQVGQHQAFAATILERYTGIVAMFSLAFVFIWVVKTVTWQVKLVVILAIIGLSVISIMAMSARLTKFFARYHRLKPIIVHIEKVQESLHLAKCNLRLLMKTLSLSFLYHVLAVVNTVLCAYAVGWYDAPALELFCVLPIILMLGSIPITPSGLGIQEGAFFYFLQGIGATPAQALGVGIILRAKTYILAIFGGVVWLFRSNPKLRQVISQP